MRVLLSLATVAALLLVPLAARAVTAQARTVEYDTTYYQIYPLVEPGEYPGRMTLTFTPNGEISGRYRDEYAGGWIHVAGGLKDRSIWLTFGGAGTTRQLKGTLNEDGTITGSLMHWSGPRTYKFAAVPLAK